MIPRWLALAEADIGLQEIVGAGHEPRILQFWRDAGIDGVADDETAWCAAALGAWLQRAGIMSTGSGRARSYETWGQPMGAPALGCVVTLHAGDPKDWRGHVGLYLGEDATHVWLCGGNQSNRVSRAWFPKARITAYRWPDVLIAPAPTRLNLRRAGAVPTDR